MLPRISIAFSAPLGYEMISWLSWTVGQTSYAKLDRDREEVDASLLGNLLAAWNARQIDIARLNETLLALDGLENLFSKPTIVSTYLRTDVDSI